MQALKTMLLHQYHISIQIFNSIEKIIHYAVNIALTETELFAIWCRINQAVQIPEVSYIIVITDTIHLVRCIFNSITYSY